MKTRTHPKPARQPSPSSLRRVTAGVLDPTRTGLLRRSFAAKVTAAFASLRSDVWRLVVTDDAFGLGKNRPPESPFASLEAVRNAGQWAFRTDPQKVEEFKQWLRQRVGPAGRKLTDEQLWTAYLEEGRRKGVGRTFDEVTTPSPPSAGPPSPTGSGTTVGAGGVNTAVRDARKKQFLNDSFNQPVNADRLKLLVGRTLDDLESVTADMGTRMTRSLADGLVQGKSARAVASDLTKVVDVTAARAKTIARTELIRAHAEGQLDGMDAMGVTELGVLVEWSTASKPCPRCSRLGGRRYTTAEARGKLPAHPNCRCAWKPVVPTFADAGPSRSNPSLTRNAFCPTGKGGGVDPTCPPRGNRPKGWTYAKHLKARVASGKVGKAAEKVKAGRRPEPKGPAPNPVPKTHGELIDGYVNWAKTRNALADKAHAADQESSFAAHTYNEALNAEHAMTKEGVRRQRETAKAFMAKQKEAKAAWDEFRKAGGDETPRQRLLRDFAHPSPASFDRRGPLSAEHAEAARAAEEFVGTLTTGTHAYNVEARAERAHYLNRSSHPDVVPDVVMNVRQTGTDMTRTHVHELGHLIEHRKPGVQQAALDFLARRVGTETPTNMKDEFGGSFESHEYGRKDDFQKAVEHESSAYYVGKVYWGTTEILSMGLEQLHRDPARFAASDPDYFRFVMGALQ